MVTWNFKINIYLKYITNIPEGITVLFTRKRKIIRRKFIFFYSFKFGKSGCELVQILKKSIHTCPVIGMTVRVFGNSPEDLGPVKPKTQKMVLDASLLNTHHYKVRIKGKVEQSRERSAPFPTPWCCSYRKGGFRVSLNYGRQLYLLYKPSSSLPSCSENKYKLWALFENFIYHT